ncbi:MAG: hypothetical protein M3Z31_15975 [Pseudomonadota bacterium]|nr:hypothetical protein [Pseudomonadota bacterium]
MNDFDHRYVRGMTAAFLATVVLSILMLLKAAMGILPDLNLIHMLAQMSGTGSPGVGWIIHFAIGTLLWGLAFGWLVPKLSGPLAWRGVVFSLGPWLLMMVLLMPLAGAGFFGLKLGIGAPLMTLMLHVIYGAVLGWSFGLIRLTARVPANPVLDPTLHP